MGKIISINTDQRYTVLRKVYVHPATGVKRDFYEFRSDDGMPGLEGDGFIDSSYEIEQQGFELKTIRSLSVTIGKLIVENFIKRIEDPNLEIPEMVDKLLDKFKYRVLTATFNSDINHERRFVLPRGQMTVKK